MFERFERIASAVFRRSSANEIVADDAQKRELEEILGPEELYGGGIIEAKFIPKITRLGDNAAIVNGMLLVLCNGDFDDDERVNDSTKWLRFDLYGELDFYYHEAEDDGDWTGWERAEIISTGSQDTKIINVFQDDIVYLLDSEM